MRVIILHNPSAGRGRAGRRLAKAVEVLHEAGVKPEIRESRSAEHLVELAQQARDERPDVVVSAGGDGTHHYVLNGLVGGDVPLGILSIGTGNDIARGVGMPWEPRAAARALLAGCTRPIDVAYTGNHYYAALAGVGFDSVVNRYANDRVKHVHGSPAYFWAILHCLGPYRPQPLELTADDWSYSGEVMFVVVGNMISYGGGLKMTPLARLDDGLLDVCIIPPVGKFELLRWAPRAYQGKHLAHPRFLYRRTRKIALTSPARLELFGDGEYLQDLPVTIEALPAAVRVIVPPTAEFAAAAP